MKREIARSSAVGPGDASRRDSGDRNRGSERFAATFIFKKRFRAILNESRRTYYRAIEPDLKRRFVSPRPES